MKTRARILYVEDDLTLSYVTRDNLALHGFQIDASDDGLDALQKLKEHSYDLCILDVMLPRMDGFTLTKKIREQNLQIPIIFLTARSTKEDKIHGLKIGGDDYITKPFSIEELVLKIEVFLKRRTITETAGIAKNLFINDRITWDPVNLLLVSGGHAHRLTQREAEVFSFLLQHRDEIVKREDLLIGLWGHDHFFSSRSLDVFISRLRKYLGNHGITIENVYNVGYRMKIDHFSRFTAENGVTNT
ncbi:MAG: response regulator transcription factor [bacterium]